MLHPWYDLGCCSFFQQSNNVPGVLFGESKLTAALTSVFGWRFVLFVLFPEGLPFSGQSIQHGSEQQFDTG